MDLIEPKSILKDGRTNDHVAGQNFGQNFGHATGHASGHATGHASGHATGHATGQYSSHTPEQIDALKIYFSDVLGLTDFVVPSNWSKNLFAAAKPNAPNELMPIEIPQNQLQHQFLSSGFINSSIAVFCEQPTDELHVLLDKILKAMGLGFEKVLCVYSQRKTLEMAHQGIYKATLVLGNRDGFDNLTEGQTEIDPRAGLILKTFSLDQLNHHLELKRLAWASLQLWIKRVKLG